MKKVLDDKIQAIATLLSKTQQEKEDAQVILSRLQHDLSQLEKNLQQKDGELTERIKTFHDQQKRQLNDLMRERESHQQALLIAEKNMALNTLKHDMIEQVLTTLSQNMNEDPDLQKAFLKKSMDFLHHKAS